MFLTIQIVTAEVCMAVVCNLNNNLCFQNRSFHSHLYGSESGTAWHNLMAQKIIFYS